MNPISENRYKYKYNNVYVNYLSSTLPFIHGDNVFFDSYYNNDNNNVNEPKILNSYNDQKNLFNYNQYNNQHIDKYYDDYYRKEEDYDIYLPWENKYVDIVPTIDENTNDLSKLSNEYKQKRRIERFEKIGKNNYPTTKHMNYYLILIVVVITILLIFAALYDMNQPYVCLYK